MISQKEDIAGNLLASRATRLIYSNKTFYEFDGRCYRELDVDRVKININQFINSFSNDPLPTTSKVQNVVAQLKALCYHHPLARLARVRLPDG